MPMVLCRWPRPVKATSARQNGLIKACRQSAHGARRWQRWGGPIFCSFKDKRRKLSRCYKKRPFPPPEKPMIQLSPRNFYCLRKQNLLRGSLLKLSPMRSPLAHDNGGTVQFSAGRIYIEAGQTAAAQMLASQLSSHLNPDDQAYAKLLEGETYLKRGDARRAVKSFEESQKLADSWIGRFDLGRAYIEMGAYTEADSELEKCLKRRGEASAVFLDDVPTFRSFPPVYYYLARAQEGLKSPAAADSYKSFLSIKEKSDELGLIGDARRRAAV